MNLRQIDLNLLIILKNLLEEKHVSNTALQLSISQPTVSRSLNRLRKLFNDPLLVKTANGYKLTSKAKFIKVELNSVLSNLENLLEGQEFNPQSSNKTLRLFGLAPQMELIAPLLLKYLRKHAPNLAVEIDTNPQPHFSTLHSGDNHFSFTSLPPQEIDQNLHGITLYQRDFSLLMSSNHPLAEQPFELDDLCQYQFGQVSLQGAKQLSSETMLRLEDHHNYQLSTPVRLTNFCGVAGIAEATDLIFHLPTRYAQSICKHRDLVVREVPEALRFYPPKELKLYWHPRFHNDPMCIWIRGVLKELTQDLT